MLISHCQVGLNSTCNVEGLVAILLHALQTNGCHQATHDRDTGPFYLDASSVFAIAHVTRHLETISRDVVQITDWFQKGRVGKASLWHPLGTGCMHPLFAFVRLRLEGQVLEVQW
jgi:hypothetical protein